jgi:translation elongation factor EF-Tu-like GTPase
MRRQGRGEVKKISELFQVYATRFKAPEKTVIKTFQEVIKDLFSVQIAEKSCSYAVHSKTLSIQNNGQLKSEILIRKNEVLSHLKGRLGEKNAPNEIL